MSISRRLPAPLSERIASATQALYSRMGREYDCAIAGIPFRLATINDLPQSVETIEVRKDQVDMENDPGEQSLTGWWRRSQASWHEGAGALYQESLDSNTVGNNGFYQSSGIDVFTKGRITLLRKMKVSDIVAGATYSRIRSFAANSTRTNLCTNPSAEVDLTGWNASDETNPPTITRDTSRSDTGTACVRVNYTGDPGTGFPPVVTAPAGAISPNSPYTVTMRVYVPTGSVGVIIVGNGVFGTGTGTTKDQWVTLTLHAESTAGGVIQAAIWPITPATASDLFYVDSVLVEEGGVVGPYFDGDSPNSVWSGTTGLSTSVETVTAATASFSAVGDGALHTSPSEEGTFSSMHAPAGKTVVDGLVSSGNFYDIASDGTLYEGLISSPGTATTWPLGATPSRLGWGKHRLWVIGGRRLWQPDLTLAAGTAQSPIFTNPNKGWSYTCMAEGPSAMYFGGHDGFQSSIQAITFDSGGSIPTLTGATVTAALPDGELVQELAVLAGQFIGIGTNRGFRVGVLSNGGAITYGPLLITPDGITGCSSVGTQGRFFLVGFRTASGPALAYRVDTSTQLADGVFVYAADFDCGITGSVTSVVPSGDSTVVCTTSDGQVWYQSPTEYVDTGWLQTGRIRFRTTEPKVFRFLDVGLEPLIGNASFELIKEGGSSLPVGAFTKQGEIASDPLSISVEAMRHASIRVTLTPNEDNSEAPVINSLLLRALPAVAPQRLITLPLICYDQEQARSGQRYGGNGFAKDRLTALQLIEDMAVPVLFQDFSISGTGQQVTIDSLRFVQTAPAPPFKSEGPGGVIVIKLRTVGQ